jgi:hypothetical protein
MTATSRTDLFGHPLGRTVGGPKLVDVEAELRRETDLAFLVFDGTTEVWLPKSLVEHDTSDNTFAMPEWLAKDKRLI